MISKELALKKCRALARKQTLEVEQVIEQIVPLPFEEKKLIYLAMLARQVLERADLFKEITKGE